MSNSNNKENIDVTKTENNNSKSQVNYKNINTVQTNHNKKYIQYIKPLLFLLQKAEQIINLINLPSSSIDKYNQLKEISFKKCGLEFTPLVKNENFNRNLQKENNNNYNQERNKENEIITMELEISELKSKLIESLLTIIETTNFSNNLNPNKNQIENSSLTISFNTFSNTCNAIKEEISKKITTTNNNKIITEKEKLLSYISRSEQNIISILFENSKKFNELKESYFILNSKIENLFKYINSIDELISPIWNKYYTKDLEWFNANKISDNYELKTYTKSHFLLNFMNQLFLDNKNIMGALSQMEQKKNEAYNILQLPYVRKAIEKGQYLKNVEDLLNKLKKEKEKNNNIDMNKLIKEGKELINCIKETINEESDNKNEEKKDNDNNVINTEEIDNYNDDMNIFLGKLMNGIQNILNKVDISIKKDELIENMMKVDNISKNKNLDISSINNINTNLNNTNMNMNTTINNGTLSKDISFISTINNDNNRTQNMSFQVYQKKTNHISGSNINKNNDNENSDKKNKNEINSIQKFDIKRKVFQKQRIEKINENPDNINNNNNNIINDKILVKSINNIINNKEEKNDIKNKNINNIKIINDDIPEEKAITVGDIGNNLSDAESTQKNKSLKDSLNFPFEENFNNKKEKDEQGIENLKNMVLEDFKIRINEEKENNE